MLHIEAIYMKSWKIEILALRILMSPSFFKEIEILTSAQ